MSQNMTVTCLRSPSILSLWERIFSVTPLGRYFRILAICSSEERSLACDVGGSERCWPQSKQNFPPSGFFFPHCGQAISSLAPHSPQNFASSGLSVPHFGHFIGISSTQDREKVSSVGGKGREPASRLPARRDDAAFASMKYKSKL